MSGESFHQQTTYLPAKSRSFFDLLADPGIRHIYRSIFELIRQPGSQPLNLTMRCDKFPFKILMSQELKQGEEGQVRVEIAYVQLERMNDEDQAFSFDQAELLRMCSWCQSIFDGNLGIWLPLEKALGFFPLLHGSELPAITHGCCPACLKNLRGKIHEYSCSR